MLVVLLIIGMCFWCVYYIGCVTLEFFVLMVLFASVGDESELLFLDCYLCGYRVLCVYFFLSS